MSLNTRLNKNVNVSKFLDLIKEADDGLMKPVEYVQLEQILSENLSKNKFLNRLSSKLIGDSTSFTLDELERYNTISNRTFDLDEDRDDKVERFEEHLNLLKKQKDSLKGELINLYNYELDDELSKEREQLNDLKKSLIKLFDDFKPLLNKRSDLEKTMKLDQQLMNRLDKLKDKKLEINRLIEEIIMHVDLDLNRDKLVKIVEREYCLKLIQIKNLLESLRNETEFILKIHRNKMIKNTIWKVYLKDFKNEIKNEENMIACADQPTQDDPSAEPSAFDFEEFKEFLSLSKNDPLDELLLQVRTALKKING